MVTTETLEQALKLLIQDTKLYRQRIDIRFERLEQSALEVNQAIAKTQVELESLSEQVKETTKQMGEQSRRMGTLVEDIVAPDMLRILRQVANIPEEVEGEVNERVKRRYRGASLNGHPHRIELDAVAECGDYVLVNETKTTLTVDHVDAFIARLGQFRDYFPELAGKQIMGAVSSLRIDSSVAKYASRQGLLVLALGEGMLQLQNEAGFQPKIF